MVDADLWHAIFGMPPEGIFVIIDARVGQGYGQLRSLPLLRRLGLENYTFTSNWRGVDLVPFHYWVINEQTSSDDLTNGFPLAQFISQSTADFTTSDASRKLMIAQRGREDNPLLVYVLESERFILPDSLGTKTFVDEYELTKVCGYEMIFVRFCQKAHHPPLAMGTDMSINLMLHHLAWTVGDQILLTRLANLFDYSRIPSTSWAWDLLKKLAQMPDIRSDDRLVYKLLRPWVDSDITRVCSRLLSTLQQFDFNVEIMENERMRISQEGGIE